VLEKELSFGKVWLRRFFSLLKMAMVPLALACLLLYPVLWMPLLILLILLLILSAVSIKLIQKRLNEPGIFIPSLLYGFLAPWYRMLARWGFDFRRKNR